MGEWAEEPFSPRELLEIVDGDRQYENLWHKATDYVMERPQGIVDYIRRVNATSPNMGETVWLRKELREAERELAHLRSITAVAAHQPAKHPSIEFCGDTISYTAGQTPKDMNGHPVLTVHADWVTEKLGMTNRLRAAFTELAEHGDLTPAGKRVLNNILDGES